jgi:hypothetical protein
MRIVPSPQDRVELTGGNLFVRGVDPTPIRNVTLAGVNIPIRIGTATSSGSPGAGAR